MKINYFYILLVIFTATCRNGEVKTKSPEVTRVKLTPVTVAAVSIPIHSTGILVSDEEMRLSFKTGGIVEKIFVNEGDVVKKGDLLASLNLSEIEAQVNQARTAWEKASRDYSRSENLYRDSVATLEQKQNAASALNLAKSAYEIAQFNLAHSKIVAPADGRILKKLARPNELMSPGFPVFLFGSSGKSWKVRASFADKDIVKIGRGDSAAVFFDAYPGEKFDALTYQVGEMSNLATGTYDVELLLSESSRRLASGFIATVELYPSAEKTYSMVPVESVVEADGQQGYVYILSDDEKSVRKTRVNIEIIKGKGVAVTGIPAGIKEVVREGAPYLRDGMNVEVIR
jgi:membrane fusion protein, multidrug efflux system